jgi:nucleotide-binding universal stress UspA family protein
VGWVVVEARVPDHEVVNAVVLTVWEPLTVEALRAARFGGWAPVPPDVSEVDEQTERQAQRLAEHGARLAGEAGFEARALWVADERRIAATIVEGAGELDADLIVMGARSLTGIAAFFGSVSNHVLQHASRPVLVVPAQNASMADGSMRRNQPPSCSPLRPVRATTVGRPAPFALGRRPT